MTRFLIATILLAAPVCAQQTAGDGNKSPRVTLRVTVTDKGGAIVNGLPATVFEVFENGKPLTLQSFKQGTKPASIGILLDDSGSMRHKLAVLNRGGHLLNTSEDSTPYVRRALSRFLDYFAGDENEFFLLVYGILSELETEFTTDPETILKGVGSPSPEGRTAFLDALKLALRKMDAASNPTRALLVISDGGDNKSTSTEKEVRDLVRKSDVSIYSIGVFGVGEPYTSIESKGHGRFSWMARQSGGKYLPIITSNDFLWSADRIGKELASQYLLGYSPEVSNSPSWRDVEVKINLGDQQKQVVAVGAKLPLRAHTRAGYYYAPSGNP